LKVSPGSRVSTVSMRSRVSSFLGHPGWRAGRRRPVPSSQTNNGHNRRQTTNTKTTNNRTNAAHKHINSPPAPPGTSYLDFVRSLHLPEQLADVDPIVASFCGGAVGAVSALLVVELNNVEKQEKSKCAV
jgi:hypothetical protein